MKINTADADVDEWLSNDKCAKDQVTTSGVCKTYKSCEAGTQVMDCRPRGDHNFFLRHEPRQLLGSRQCLALLQAVLAALANAPAPFQHALEKTIQLLESLHSSHMTRHHGILWPAVFLTLGWLGCSSQSGGNADPDSGNQSGGAAASGGTGGSDSTGVRHCRLGRHGRGQREHRIRRRLCHVRRRRQHWCCRRDRRHRRDRYRRWARARWRFGQRCLPWAAVPIPLRPPRHLR